MSTHCREKAASFFPYDNLTSSRWSQQRFSPAVLLGHRAAGWVRLLHGCCAGLGQHGQVLAGPVAVRARAALHSYRGVLTANELTVFQDTEGHVAEVDAGLVEGAELHLACPWCMDLQLPTFEVAIVELNIA